MKIRNNEQRGITLIALIITIIVLLILAGIALNLVIGERGIFNRATQAKIEHEIGQYIDKIELSRGTVAVNNFGVVTLDNLIEQIYVDNVVPRGSITKIDETTARVVTPEGYIFEITADSTKYIEKGEGTNPPGELPDLDDAIINIKVKPEGWTNKDVTVEITTDAQEVTIKYGFDGTTWTTYSTPLTISKNTIIYAYLEDSQGNIGEIAIREIGKIDKLDPIQIVPVITVGSDTISIDASQAKDAVATTDYAQSGIKSISYSKDNGVTWETNTDIAQNTYTYEGLQPNNKYQIKVKIVDNAENETFTQMQEVTTKADLSGHFTWKLNSDNSYSVTGLTDTGKVIADLEIPSSYNGLPVTAIADANPTSFTNGNKVLTSVKIPDTVTSIGKSAFYGCSTLKRINSDTDGVVNLPSNLTKIGNSAFYNCDLITDINFDKELTTIGDSAFEYCDGIKSVKIEGNNTSIGTSAFFNCKGITEIILGDGVTSIGEDTFNGCAATQTVTIGKGVTTIGDEAFSQLLNLTTINYNAVNCSDTRLLLFYNGGKNNANVKLSIGSEVNRIPAYMFSGVYFSGTITIPNNVTELGVSCFDSTGASKFVIGSGITTIPDSAFYGRFANGKLTSVEMSDSVTTIGPSAFGNNPLLTDIKFSANLETIGNESFGGAGKIVNLIIPNKVTTIGKNAFSGCSSLKTVYIPRSVKTIPGATLDEGPFMNTTQTLKIYHELTNKPSGWGEYWHLCYNTGVDDGTEFRGRVRATTKGGVTQAQYESTYME